MILSWAFLLIHLLRIRGQRLSRSWRNRCVARRSNRPGDSWRIPSGEKPARCDCENNRSRAPRRSCRVPPAGRAPCESRRRHESRHRIPDRPPKDRRRSRVRPRSSAWPHPRDRLWFRSPRRAVSPQSGIYGIAVYHSRAADRRYGGRLALGTLLKRAVYGQFHSVSEAHLHRYLAEADFKYNTRKISDVERAETLLRGAKGKRLMYRQPDQAQNA